ncbi:MAG: VTT domain-containing protein [Gammaproteobacteria bacterium]
MPRSKPSADHTSRTLSICSPGDNCWAIESADRASVIIDTAAYFHALSEACAQARHQILILGWDFDRRERLHRDDDAPRTPAGESLPDGLGDFLTALVRERPDLHVHLLSWDYSMIYAAEREMLPALRLRLQAPPRFHIKLDGCHPPGASQHQKLVVIDDRVAFIGGIDLSRWRWDTPDHEPDDPRRIDPDGAPYPPFHDMMVCAQGDVAAKLGELARERWRRAFGTRIEPPPSETGDDTPAPWPESIEPELSRVPVAIARTYPKWRKHSEVREVEQLYLDAIANAKQTIYIENQYFTAQSLARALGKRLAEDDGPEVVLVLPKQTGGWLEQVTMDVLRARVIARMQEADAHGRLKVYYPHQPGLGEQCISVHAKLMITDDRLLRIGSSNTSNRSMGLDSECDIAIEAAPDDRATSAYVRGLRHRLLAEHLDSDPQTVADREDENSSMIAAIASLQSEGRSLRELDCSVPADVDEMVPDDGVIDPTEPLSGEYFVAQYVPEEGQPKGRKRLITFALVIVALLALAVSWRWTPMASWLSPESLAGTLNSIAAPHIQALVTIVLIALAALAMVPVSLLAIAVGITFGGWQAFGLMISGALLGALLGFLGGRVLSKGMIERLAGTGVDKLSRRLADRGILAVALLRLVPIAPFSVFNLVAGASHIRLRQFLAGSLLGFIPGLGAITLFSSSLWDAIRNPTLTSLTWALGIGLIIAGLAWLANRWLRS